MATIHSRKYYAPKIWSYTVYTYAVLCYCVVYLIVAESLSFFPSFFLVFISHLSFSLTVTWAKAWLQVWSMFKVWACASCFVLATPPPLSLSVRNPKDSADKWTNCNVNLSFIIVTCPSLVSPGQNKKIVISPGQNNSPGQNKKTWTMDGTRCAMNLHLVLSVQNAEPCGRSLFALYLG